MTFDGVPAGTGRPTTPDLVDPAEAGLTSAHAQSKAGPYLSETWRRRSYAWYVAQSELRQRQVTTVMGSLWYLLNPVLSIAIYFLVFGLVLETNRGFEGTGEYLLFLTVGLFVFQHAQRAVTQGSSSIFVNAGLMRAIRFPRVMLPISSTVTEALTAVPTYVVIYVVALVVGQQPLLTWLLLPLIAFWQLLFNLGAAMITARMTTRFRDTHQLLPFLFRLLLYASGVIFSVDDYVSHSGARLLFVLNPVYGFITISRWAMMGSTLDVDVVAACAGWTVFLLVGGFFWFKAAEHTYDRI